MSRYIDSDTLIRYGKCGTLVYWEDIEDAPSIDIVRCKECKHWHEFIDAKGRGRCEADAHNPFRVSIGVSDADFFCSYGERREP